MPISPVRVASVFLCRGTCFYVSRRTHLVGTFPGHWQNVGGKADADESLLSAAVRETHEETGLRINPTRFVRGITLAAQFENGLPYTITAFVVQLHADEFPQRREPHKAGPWHQIPASRVHEITPIVPKMIELTSHCIPLMTAPAAI